MNPIDVTPLLIIFKRLSPGFSTDQNSSVIAPVPVSPASSLSPTPTMLLAALGFRVFDASHILFPAPGEVQSLCLANSASPSFITSPAPRRCPDLPGKVGIAFSFSVNLYIALL